MTALIVRDDARLQVAFTEAALALREEAIAGSALIARVCDASENEVAVTAQARIKSLLTLAEKSRVECKAPVREFGELIDNRKKSFCLPLEEELSRIAKVIGDFQALELAKKRAAEAANRLEEEQIERERQAELRAISDDRLKKSEAIAAAESAAREKSDTALLAEIEKQKELAKAASHEALEAVHEKFNQLAAELVVPEPVRAAGQIVTEEWIIDSISEWTVAKARPDLVRKYEFDLVAIKKDLAKGLKIPGIVAHKEVRSSVRANPAMKAIEI